jgi:hypothetical protein
MLHLDNIHHITSNASNRIIKKWKFFNAKHEMIILEHRYGRIIPMSAGRTDILQVKALARQVEQTLDEWYYTNTKSNIVIKIDNVNQFCEENAKFIEKSNQDVLDIQLTVSKIISKIGNCTSYTDVESRWYIKSPKIYVKIIINNYDKSDITFEYTLNVAHVGEQGVNWKKSTVNESQLLSFIDKNLDKLLEKEIELPKIKKLNIDESNIPHDNTLQLTREQLRKKYDHIFITKPIEKRIEYQMCIPYNIHDILIKKSDNL